jgi:acetyl esterase/lipase
MSEVRLADDTVVWGHSQGGGAALWSGVLASSYAPELKIGGVAALAPASNLPGLIENLGNVQAGELFASYVIEGYTSTYPDVRYADYVRPSAQLIVHEMSQRCLTDKSVLVSVLSTLLFDKPIWEGDPDRGALSQRLRENIPSGPIAAPLLLAQGAADSLVVPTAQDAYVSARCAAGYAVDYRKYEGRDHVALVQPDSPLIPELLSWTHDRFDGKPATNTCGPS